MDLNLLALPEGYFERTRPAMDKAFAAMNELEGGAIANPDEKRMVGHYWLRDSSLAPDEGIREEIETTRRLVTEFAKDVHRGKVAGEGGPFTDLLVIGIGGSALGPQFVAQALGRPGEDRMAVHFFDNTDTDGLLAGAARMDALTRTAQIEHNPAALLALAWHHCTEGKGAKDMVILPYKDRLGLLSKYLQQLIMESLGKERDLDGNIVHQGIAVYGNKGSTDQHAYVQQLREGVPNFFATFIAVLKDREGASVDVEDGVTSGDYLHAFLLGTRAALAEKDRRSLTLTIGEVTPESVGMLIALYERAVGLYASLVNINAYHQPGVEAGKKAAAAFLGMQADLLAHLREHADDARTAVELASALGLNGKEGTVHALLEHIAANPSKGVRMDRGSNRAEDTFRHAVT